MNVTLILITLDCYWETTYINISEYYYLKNDIKLKTTLI